MGSPRKCERFPRLVSKQPREPEIDHIVGLGKETNRIEAGRVLGIHAVGGKPRRYLD